MRGAPLPPGPVPPEAPREVRALNAPEGIELQLVAPALDLDGEPLDAKAVRYLAFIDQPACDGLPVASGATPLMLPAGSGLVRVVASVEGRRGPASAPLRVNWQTPPPAPEAPLAFVDAKGQVQLTWLPPAAERVRILRNGVVVAEVAAADALHTDAAPPGRHRYALIAVGADFRTAPSAAVKVRVRRRPARK